MTGSLAITVEVPRWRMRIARVVAAGAALAIHLCLALTTKAAQFAADGMLVNGKKKKRVRA